jgi:glycosyltransferase involved in cell wall biosynthesis
VVADGIRFRFVAEPAGVPSAVSHRIPRRLVAAVAAERPDVIHLQGLGFPIAARLLSATGVPVLAHDHADRPGEGWRRRFRRWGMASVAGVAFTARELARRFVDAGVLRPDVPVFEVLESTSDFTPGDRDEARRRTGIGGDPCLLWVGRLDANKDPLTVLDALAAAAPRIPHARLWMCHAEAPLEAAVRRRIAEDPALAERVHLLGRVPHHRVQELCRAADFLVAASRFESTGYAVLEAAACGAAPLVTDIPALRRVTRGGAVGGLFPPGDSAALARLMVEAAGWPREQTRRAVRAHFDGYLSLDALSAELAAAYAGVAGRGR